MTRHRPGNLLCVANFPANTGFAWTFIEGLFAGLADRLAADGVETWVAYPEIADYPQTLVESVAEPVELSARLTSTSNVRALARFVRDREVGTVYFCDSPTWHWADGALRLAGVRHIVVHDHMSGARSEPRGVKRVIKRARNALPGLVPDLILSVSDFVSERLRTINLAPPERIVRVWNSVEIPTTLKTAEEKRALLRDLGVDEGSRVAGCAARTTPVKGVTELLRAFDIVWRRWPGQPKPALVYLGDGPAFDDVAALHQGLAARESIILAGYRADAAEILGCVDVAVVPSLWQEAFGLAALEPLSWGVPVVASRVGGIPEVVDDGRSGYLVDPGNVDELAEAMERLLVNEKLGREYGDEGRKRALRDFSRSGQVDVLERLFRDLMGVGR
jgi:glycosyltransferase involved in cell wall biosynthesis